MLKILTVKLQKLMHIEICKNLQGSNLVNYGFQLFVLENVYKFEIFFLCLHSLNKKLIPQPYIQIQYIGGSKNIIHPLLIVCPPKLCFFTYEVDHLEVL